jgi:hypothetical protein
MGPKKNDGFKKRWFTLDNRKLMYSEDPLVQIILFSLTFGLHQVFFKVLFVID